MDAVVEPIAETPTNIVKPAKTFFITKENAKELRAKATEAKKRNELAMKQRIAELEAECKLAKPLIAQAAAVSIEPRDSFVSNRLRIVREQLSQLDRDLAEAEDWKATKAICDSIKALSDVERILDGRALPGSRRPGRETPSKRSGEVGPVE